MIPPGPRSPFSSPRPGRASISSTLAAAAEAAIWLILFGKARILFLGFSSKKGHPLSAVSLGKEEAQKPLPFPCAVGRPLKRRQGCQAALAAASCPGARHTAGRSSPGWSRSGACSRVRIACPQDRCVLGTRVAQLLHVVRLERSECRCDE